MLLSLRLGRIASLQMAASNNPPLMVGMTNDGVAAVQSLLRDLGYDFPASFRKGKADGIFGAETKRNVEAFQGSVGLKRDGIVGRMTLAAFDQLIIKNNILEERTEAELAFHETRERSLPLGLRTHFVT
jgi:peptidoglycan hydrolase-like protein with peptidoglycan-binding domain